MESKQEFTFKKHIIDINQFMLWGVLKLSSINAVLIARGMLGRELQHLPDVWK